MTKIQPKRIAFVGAGNVAWHMAQALAVAGHHVEAVYSRGSASREALATLLPQAQPVATLDFRGMDLDLVMIAVPDASLEAVVSALHVEPGTVVVHTSGAQSLTPLQSIEGANVGVFYPLQTFSKSKLLDFSQVPLLLESDKNETLQLLEQVAKTISSQVHRMDFDDRKRMHLAAVFACNFTNHLLGISQLLLQEAKLPTALLYPLLKETIAKATTHNPFEVQTGPAVRGDEQVLQAHLQMLQEHPRYQALYRQLSQSIQAEAAQNQS